MYLREKSSIFRLYFPYSTAKGAQAYNTISVINLFFQGFCAEIEFSQAVLECCLMKTFKNGRKCKFKKCKCGLNRVKSWRREEIFRGREKGGGFERAE